MQILASVWGLSLGLSALPRFSTWVGKQHRSLPWGSRFCLSEYWWLHAGSCPLLGIFNTVRVLFGCHSANCLSKTPFTDFHSTTLFVRSSTSTTCARVLVADCASGENPNQDKCELFVYIYYLGCHWYISYSGVMKIYNQTFGSFFLTTKGKAGFINW